MLRLPRLRAGFECCKIWAGVHRPRGYAAIGRYGYCDAVGGCARRPLSRGDVVLDNFLPCPVEFFGDDSVGFEFYSLYVHSYKP